MGLSIATHELVSGCPQNVVSEVTGNNRPDGKGSIQLADGTMLWS